MFKPGCVSASATIKMLVSLPAGKLCGTPLFIREPVCAKLASPLKALLLTMNCCSEPCPVRFLLTMVLKLNPKSTPVVPVAFTATVVIDCGTVVAVVNNPKLAAPSAASSFVGV